MQINWNSFGTFLRDNGITSQKIDFSEDIFVWFFGEFLKAVSSQWALRSEYLWSCFQLLFDFWDINSWESRILQQKWFNPHFARYNIQNAHIDEAYLNISEIYSPDALAQFEFFMNTKAVRILSQARNMNKNKVKGCAK